MDSITVVNDSIATLRPHLPALQDPAARMLYDTIGAALHRQGMAHLLNDVAGNESEIKRVLRQTVRDDPQFGVALSQASVAARSTAGVPTQAPPPAALPAPPPAPVPALRRPDLAAAVEATPGTMRHQIFGAAARCVELVDTSLPEDEQVLAVSLASVRPEAPENCVLVLTDRRLIFVAPRPQVVAYRLAGLKKSQAFNGYFFLEGDAGEYSVGLPDGPWSREFEQRVFDASALAVLTGR